jgi:Protein of unknown function (DUF559)
LVLDERIVDIVSRQHGVISRRQLQAAGLSSTGIGHRVRRRRLFPVLHGVYALGPHVDLWGRRHAAVLSVGGRFTTGPPRGETNITTVGSASARDTGRVGDAATSDRSGPAASDSVAGPRIRVALSHWSVLHLHGLIERPPSRFHVTVEGTGGRPHAAVHIHRARTLRAADVEILDGLPVTTAARTILDAGLGASVAQVQRLIREAEYRQLLEVGAIADVVRRNPFHPANRLVRVADPHTAEARLIQTPIEDRMAAIVDRLPIGRPETQFALTGRSGRPYRADFAWPDLQLIVETDGRSAHDRSSSFQSDRDRDADLAAVGWLTLRFTSLQRDDPARAAATIVATAQTRRTAS